MHLKTIMLLSVSLLVRFAQAETAGVYFNTNTLLQIYDGTPRVVTATTDPAGLALEIRYEGDIHAPSEAGYYEVIATVTSPGWTGAATNYLAIDRAPQSIHFSLPGTAAATSTLPLAATSTSGQSPYFGVISGPGYLVSNTLYFTNQGACVVAACVNGDENWRDACAAVTVQVSRATATVILTDLTQPYNGDPIEADAVTNPDYLPIEITYDGSLEPPVNVGSYAVMASIDDPQWDGSATGTLTITKGEQVILFITPGICSLTETSELIAVTSSDLTPQFSLIEGPAILTENSGQYDATYTATGRVSIVASQPGNANWLAATPVTNTFFVYENPVQITVEDNLATYDGSNHAARLIIPDGSSLTSNDMSVTYSGSIIPPRDAGTYDIVVLITNPPSINGGFIGYLTILQADDEITDFDPPKTIIATQQLSFAAATRSGRPCAYYAYPDDIATIEDETNLVFASAGDVLVYAYVEESTNWTDAELSTWITATKAQAAINLTNLFQPFDGTPRVVTAQAEVPTVTITYSGTTNPPTAAGRYPVVGLLDNPLFAGSVTGTLIVLDRPDVTIVRSGSMLTITWHAEPGLFYSVQNAALNYASWNDLPPYTNLTGEGTLAAEISMTNTVAAGFRVVAFP
jgi:hypothetical protein